MHDSKADAATARRRTVLAGAGAAGALAAAATLLPQGQQPAAVVAGAGAEAAKPGSPDAKGYRLTEHVKRYYATARI